MTAGLDVFRCRPLGAAPTRTTLATKHNGTAITVTRIRGAPASSTSTISVTRYKPTPHIITKYTKD